MHEVQPYRFTQEHLDGFADFSCGDDPWCPRLEGFLKENALPEGNARLNTTYVFYDDAQNAVAYVTLTGFQISRKEGGLLLLGRRRQPYPSVPALLIGRFAVDKRHQGKRFGTSILGWIEKMAVSLPVAFRFLALHVEAENEGATQMYQRFGFIIPEHVQASDDLRLMLYDLIDTPREDADM